MVKTQSVESEIIKPENLQGNETIEELREKYPNESLEIINSAHRISFSEKVMIPKLQKRLESATGEDAENLKARIQNKKDTIELEAKNIARQRGEHVKGECKTCHAKIGESFEYCDSACMEAGN
ncbi:MAG: hypothetical protein OXC46_03065 [Thaumarchaeota archaeon]|nr:hypothetical protein [Nitrososphaerota archaeon]